MSHGNLEAMKYFDLSSFSIEYLNFVICVAFEKKQWNIVLYLSQDIPNLVITNCDASFDEMSYLFYHGLKLNVLNSLTCFKSFAIIIKLTIVKTEKILVPYLLSNLFDIIFLFLFGIKNKP